GISIFVETDVIEAHRRAEEEASPAAFIGHAATGGDQRALPVAVHGLVNRLAIGGSTERAPAAEIDQAGRTTAESAEAAPLAPPIGGQLISIGQQAVQIAAVVGIVPEPGGRRPEAAQRGIDLAPG